MMTCRCWRPGLPNQELFILAFPNQWHGGLMCPPHLTPQLVTVADNIEDQWNQRCHSTNETWHQGQHYMIGWHPANNHIIVTWLLGQDGFKGTWHYSLDWQTGHYPNNVLMLCALFRLTFSVSLFHLFILIIGCNTFSWYQWNVAEQHVLMLECGSHAGTGWGPLLYTDLYRCVNGMMNIAYIYTCAFLQ